MGGVVACGDLFDALPARLRARVDVLVVNAPYVPTAAIALMPPEARDHEPGVALDGGADGLDVAAGSPPGLPGGSHRAGTWWSRRASGRRTGSPPR